MRIIALRLGLALGLLVTSINAAHAADGYPSKPIRLIAPFGPGSTVDVMARAIAAPLSEQLGQPVFVDNRSGAGGNIGVAAVATAPKDGYTLGIGTTGPLTINPTLMARVPFDPVKDLAAVSQVASGPNVIIVNSSMPVQTLKELIALAKGKPGDLAYGSAGIGSTNHLAGELFSSMAGVKLTHVPYKSNQDALTDLLGGRIQILFSGVPPVLPQIKAGKVRALAIAGTKRVAALPDVLTVAELGLAGADVMVWYGVIAPAGTPLETIRRIQAELVKVMARPAVRELFVSTGSEPMATTPDEFAKVIRDDLDKWRGVIKGAGIKAE